MNKQRTYKPRTYTSFIPVKGWVEQTCQICKKTFWRRPTTLKKRRKNICCSIECAGKIHHKGGKWIDKYGYVLIRQTDHPYTRKNWYIPEHRLVMEKYLGRYLLPTETVHHKNGHRNDNRIENLELRSGNHGKGISIDDMIHTLETYGYTVTKI